MQYVTIVTYEYRLSYTLITFNRLTIKNPHFCLSLCLSLYFSLYTEDKGTHLTSSGKMTIEFPVKDTLYCPLVAYLKKAGCNFQKKLHPAFLPGDIDYIILHEQVHIARRNNLFRIVAVITACVHWFNPLLWVFLKYFFADMELACDAKVLKSLNECQTKEYALTILTCASGKTFFASAFGGGAKTKVRIENILSYKKLTVISSLFFDALVVAIAVIIITNATV